MFTIHYGISFVSLTVAHANPFCPCSTLVQHSATSRHMKPLVLGMSTGLSAVPTNPQMRQRVGVVILQSSTFYVYDPLLYVQEPIM